jgi:hypothetical protein
MMKSKRFYSILLVLVLGLVFSVTAFAAIVPDETASFDSATDLESTGWFEFADADVGVLSLETEGDGKFLRYILASDAKSWITPTLNIYEFINELEPDDYDLTLRFDIRLVAKEGSTPPSSYEISALIRGMSDADLNSFILIQHGGNRYTPLVKYDVSSEEDKWTTCEFDLYVEEADFRESEEEIYWNFCLFSEWDPAVIELHLDNFQIVDNNAPEPVSSEESSSENETSAPGGTESASGESDAEDGLAGSGWLPVAGIAAGVVLVVAIVILVMKKSRKTP